MIYLDHAAATPVLPPVLEAMEPFFTTDFFNPSAAYLPAKHVSEAYQAAKAEIAHAIGAKGNDLVITGSATEANNLAFSAVSSDGEVLCLATEHASVREVAWHSVRRNSAQKSSLINNSQETRNQTSVSTKQTSPEIAVHPNGLIDLENLKNKITDRTELISVALVNNELGTIQPLSEISVIIRDIRQTRLMNGNKRPLYLHSDASQALNLLDISAKRLGVDLLTLNAAKIYGPKGVGALYVSHDVKLEPITIGGGQERGLRSGTENVPGVIGFAKAITLAKSHIKSNRKKYSEFKQILLSELQDYELINKKHTLDNFLVLCYNGIDAERLIYLLEEQKVYVATGAACAASKGEKSHVLAAIGLSDSQIAGSLRLTLGETNIAEQMHEAAKLINQAVAKERERING